MLRENRFKVAPRYWGRVGLATFLALINSLGKRIENLCYGSAIRDAKVASPLFVLGCWRSGTTHLHNLLTKDERFAFTNTFQVINPHTFLFAERFIAPIQNLFYPRVRAMDNVAFAADQPQEDEFAITIMSRISPMMSLFFWERRDYYNRYTTFRDAPEAEMNAWKDAFMHFLKKLATKTNKTLVLKSPAHTGKVRELLELFPDAKFVMIHRHPYEIVVSAIHMCEKNLPLTSLQNADLTDCGAEIVEHYGQLFDSYFEQRSLIPPGNLVEISFEELQERPVDTLRHIYAELSLPDFSVAEPAFQDYLESLQGYSKNKHAELNKQLRTLINDRWRANFANWEYTKS